MELPGLKIEIRNITVRRSVRFQVDKQILPVDRPVCRIHAFYVLGPDVDRIADLAICKVPNNNTFSGAECQPRVVQFENERPAVRGIRAPT